MTDQTLAMGLALVGSAAIANRLSYFLLPALRRYALARPNSRSSHKEPTPQGGGVAVIAATISVSLAAATITGIPLRPLMIVFAFTAFIAAIGMIDDIWTIPVLPRLAAQAFAIAIVVAALPQDLRVVQWLPWWP
jgi:UDP-N-acetylmuramyl pentapeptide phosphotransferase/UDP-N-acetylglucosamine-1-phosphate transferase